MNRIQITPHFNLVEFASRDGEEVPQEFFDNVQKLCRNLEVLRDELCCPIHILSGYRTPSHNKFVGGVPNSQHLYANAADIITKRFTPFEIHKIIEELISKDEMEQGGLGLYKGFVHYDVRGRKTRWTG